MDDGPLLHVLSSIAAAFFSCTFSAPADIVMTRYRALPSTHSATRRLSSLARCALSTEAAQVIGRAYDGPVDCVKTMVREEGVGVFFRGWSPFFVRVVPLFVINLPLYEQIRRVLGIGYLN